MNEEIKSALDTRPGVTVITPTNHPGFMEQVFANYLRQRYEPRELIVVLNNNSMNLKEWRAKAAQYENIRIYQLDEQVTYGQCLNYAVEQARFDYIANVDDDDYYAAPYLENAMATFTYINTDVVGKGSLYVYYEAIKTLANMWPERENHYVTAVAGATLVFKKEVFNKLRFPDLNCGPDSGFTAECIKKGYRIYANDRFNFVYIRRQNKDHHTWQIEDDILMRCCKFVSQTDDYISPTTSYNLIIPLRTSISSIER